MKIYLVGGAVRDKLLGLSIKEKDWVVVGGTTQEMLQQGFRSVGKDFPVFIHPITHEEYALARTERKVGRGYTGFDFNTAKNVTLEEDLLRRDLTINAIAETEDGKIIDPFHGVKDIEQKILRHVSPAFVEDPVRILRVARFSARFSPLGFKIAPETLSLMQRMVSMGEVDALVPERVWKEWERALKESAPEQFFNVLDACYALPKLFPEIPINSKGLIALKTATHFSSDIAIRMASLLHDLSAENIQILCDRYRIPKEYKELAILVSTQLKTYQMQSHLSPLQIIEFLQITDAFRREARFKKFLSVCEIITKKKSTALLQCYSITKNIDIKKLIALGWAGKELAEKIKEERIRLICEWKQSGVA